MDGIARFLNNSQCSNVVWFISWITSDFRTLVNIFVGRKWGGEMSIFFRWSFEACGENHVDRRFWRVEGRFFVELNHSERGESHFSAPETKNPTLQAPKKALRNGCLLEDDEDPVGNRRPIFRGLYLDLNFVGRQQTFWWEPSEKLTTGLSQFITEYIISKNFWCQSYSYPWNSGIERETYGHA